MEGITAAYESFKTCFDTCYTSQATKHGNNPKQFIKKGKKIQGRNQKNSSLERSTQATYRSQIVYTPKKETSENKHSIKKGCLGDVLDILS